MQRYSVYFINKAGGSFPPFKKRGGYLELMGSRLAPTARIVLKTEAGKTFVCDELNIEALTQVGLPRRNWAKVDFRKLPHQLLMMLCFLAVGLWVGGTPGGIIASLGVLLIPLTGFFPPHIQVVVALRASDSEDEESTLILSLPIEAYRQLFADDLLKAS